MRFRRDISTVFRVLHLICFIMISENAYGQEARSLEFGDRLNEYNCFNQVYQRCEGIDDLRGILRDNTSYTDVQIDQLIFDDVNGGRSLPFSGLDCHVRLVWIAHSLQYGLGGVEENVCAARNISEYVLDHSWKEVDGKADLIEFGSTVTDSLSSLDEMYLGSWGPLRSGENNKTAQCFHSVSILKNILDRSGVGSQKRIKRKKIPDIASIIEIRASRVALGLLERSATGSNGNKYSEFIVDQVQSYFGEGEFPALTLTYEFGGDRLCAGNQGE